MFNIRIFYFLVSLFLLFSLIYGLYNLYSENQYLEKKLDHINKLILNKYNVQMPNGIIEGVAYGDYFCVWSKGKTIIQDLEICTEEYAHNNLGLIDP